jgi:hypothetical protein
LYHKLSRVDRLTDCWETTRKKKRDHLNVGRQTRATTSTPTAKKKRVHRKSGQTVLLAEVQEGKTQHKKGTRKRERETKTTQKCTSCCTLRSRGVCTYTHTYVQTSAFNVYLHASMCLSVSLFLCVSHVYGHFSFHQIKAGAVVAHVAHHEAALTPRHFGALQVR